jgi:hypothetical protein
MEQGCQMVFFKPKIPIWINFGGSCNGRCWFILRPLGLFYDYWVYFVAVWYFLLSFGIFFPFWYVGEGKIWQPCHGIKLITRSKEAELMFTLEKIDWEWLINNDT